MDAGWPGWAWPGGSYRGLRALPEHLGLRPWAEMLGTDSTWGQLRARQTLPSHPSWGQGMGTSHL